MELLHAFGIDIRIFLAQLINFSVLVFLLYRFAYHPVLEMLDERKTKIAEGLKNAALANEKLQGAKEEADRIITGTKEESKAVLGNARQSAEKLRESIQKEAEEKAKSIVSQALAQAEDERRKILSEAKSEVHALAMEVVEKILGEQVDESRDKNYRERVVGHALNT